MSNQEQAIYHVDGNGNVIVSGNNNSTITINMHNPENIRAFLQSVEDQIEQLPAQLLALLKDAIVQYPKQLTSLPDNLTDFFVGRDADLNELSDLLINNSSVVLVNGMGGIGKSALAQVYLQKHGKDYDHIAFVKVLSEFDEKNDNQINNEDALIDAFADHPTLSNNLKLAFSERTSNKQKFALILQKLSQLEGNNLLIIDNANESVAKYREQLPSKQFWKIVLTSRQKITHIKTHLLGVLDAENARLLFYNYYEGEQDDTNLDRILAFIGYHTLTIELLAKQANDRCVSIVRLIEMLEERSLNIPLKAKVAPLSSHKTKTTIRHLLDTFILDIDKDSLHYLRYFSVLPSIWMTFDELRNYFLIPNGTPFEDFFFKMMSQLSRKGWVRKGKHNDYVCHQVIQEVVRRKSKPTIKRCQTLINSFIEKTFVDNRTGDHGINKKHYIPFVESIVKHLHEKDNSLAQLIHSLATLLNENGDYQKSLAHFQRAIAIRELILDENHSDLADTYNSVAITYRHQNDYEKSIEFQEKSIKIKEILNSKGLEVDEASVAISYHNLAVACRYNKDYAQSIAFFNKAIDSYLTLKEPHLLGLAATYTQLGSAYRLVQDFEKSEASLFKGIDIYKKQVGEEHRDLATAYTLLSNMYEDKGDSEQDLKYTQLAVNIYEKDLDPLHPYLLVSYKNLAVAYFTVKDYESAAFFMGKVVHGRRKVLPANHADLVNVEQWLLKIRNSI